MCWGGDLESRWGIGLVGGRFLGGLDVLGGLRWYGVRWDLRSFAMVSVAKRSPIRAVRLGLHRRSHNSMMNRDILDFFNKTESRAVTGLGSGEVQMLSKP